MLHRISLLTLLPFGLAQAFQPTAPSQHAASFRRRPSKQSMKSPAYDPTSATLLASSSNQESEFVQGPNIPWTIADLFANPPGLAVFYQSAGTPYDVGTPLGTVLGAALQPIVFSSSSLIQTAANGGLVCGFAGIAFGIVRYAVIARAASDSDMQIRRDEVTSNSYVRALDAGTYTGCAIGALTLAVAGGPVSLGLASGFLGALQGLSLGAAGGSLVTMAYIAALRQQH